MKITMFTRTKEADMVPAKWSTSCSDLKHFLCFLLTFCLFCCLGASFLLNKKEGKILQIKDRKVVYSGSEAGEMVCVNSDSEGDDVDLAKEFVYLDLDSDWEEKMEMHKIVRT